MLGCCVPPAGRDHVLRYTAQPRPAPPAHGALHCRGHLRQSLTLDAALKSRL
jgi:hypothetical protein